MTVCPSFLKGLIEKHFNDKNTELIRLQCYEGIDYTKVLYDVDYAKKLLRQTLYQGVAQQDIQAMLQGRKFKDYYNSIYGQIVEILNEKGYNLVKEATKYGGTSYTCKSIKEVCNNG